jgi:proteasome lid subunit RPN8/RPN11
MMSEQAQIDFQQHAREAWPGECCGIVSGGTYRRLLNVAPDPAAEARVSLAQWKAVRAEAEVFCHSHTNGCNYPSRADMEAQLAADIPFALTTTDGQACTPVSVWGRGAPRPPLLGRPFQHGITDCYEAIRDDFALNDGIELPSYPRDWMWWEAGGDLYEQFFQSAGFAEVAGPDVRPGDCAMITRPGRRSSVICHAGRLKPQGLMFHHACRTGGGWQPKSLSELTPVERWRPYIVKWVRYVG